MKKIIKLLFLIIVISSLTLLPGSITNAASAKDYDFTIVYQTRNDDSLLPESKTSLSIELKNTGNKIWDKGSFRLGTGSNYGISANQGRDNLSIFKNDTWISGNRPFQTDQDIKPGETLKINFIIDTPKEDGKYKIYFTPLIENKTWLNDIGIYWEINVKNSTLDKTVYSSNDNSKNNVLLNKFIKASVKLLCYEKEGWLQQGSGLLVKNDKNIKNLPQYYITTNLHVVRPEAKELSQCSIYFNNQDTSHFSSNGFKNFKDNIDLAIIEPEENISDFYKDELENFSINNSEINLVSTTNSNLKNNFTALGYPNGKFEIKNFQSTLSSAIYDDTKYNEITSLLNHGISGGILLDNKQNLIGLTSSRIGDIGLILNLNYLKEKYNIEIF